MPIIAKLDWVNATDTAVPIKGAEHGVANKVAKKPLIWFESVLIVSLSDGRNFIFNVFPIY